MITKHLPDNWTQEQRGTRLYIFDETGKARCGAKNAKGKPCMKSPVKGHCRCKTHGAANPTGKNHGRYTHGKRVGRYDIPSSLNERFQEMQADENLQDLRENIVLIDGRIQLLLDKLESGDTGHAILPKLFKLYHRAEKYLRDRDMSQFANVWLDMGQLIQAGKAESLLWDDILDANDKRAKMTRAASDIALARHKAASLNEVMYLMHRIVDTFQTSNELDTQEARKAAFVAGLRNLLNETN